MRELSAKHRELEIKLYLTPSTIGVRISKERAAIEPWLVLVPWDGITQTPTESLANELMAMWQREWPEASVGFLDESVRQALLILLKRAGTSSPEFAYLSALPLAEGWKTENRFYMGEDGFAGYFHDQYVQVRYFKQDDGFVQILPDYAPWLPSIVVANQQFRQWFLSHKEIDEKQFAAWNNIRKSSKTFCYNPDCPTGDKAVRSHILQQKGVFSELIQQSNGGARVVELVVSNPTEEDRTGFRYALEYAGVNRSSTLAYWGFCAKCDPELFKVIEKGAPNFSDPRNQLLLSYRAHLNELSKQEYNVLYHRALRADPYYPLITKFNNKPNHLQQALCCQVGYGVKALLEQELAFPSASAPFQFIHFALPKVLIATSATYSGAARYSVNEAELLAFEPGFRQAHATIARNQEHRPVFLHLIPEKTQLTVVLGYDSQLSHIQGVPVFEIAKLDTQQKFKLLSDIIITRLETWCVAPSVYQKWQASGLDQKILQAITHHRDVDKKDLPVGVNLFDGLV